MAGKFPPNCRVFIGNLASSKTTPEELKRIFSKYGRLGEEPVIRKNFGFVQFLDPSHAEVAIQQESGRVIGGSRVDLNLADNRPARRLQTENGLPPLREEENRRDRQDRGFREEFAGNSYTHERHPRAAIAGWAEENLHGLPRRKGNDGIRVDPDPSVLLNGSRVKPPENLNDVFIIRVDSPTKRYCLTIEEEITKLGLLYESREVQLFELPDTLKVAAELSRIKHIMIVGSRHEALETVTISTRLPSGLIEEFREIPVVEALRQLVSGMPQYAVGDDRAALRHEGLGGSLVASAALADHLGHLRDSRLSILTQGGSSPVARQDFRADPHWSELRAGTQDAPSLRGRLIDSLGSAPQTADPPEVHEMLQSFLHQIQSSGGHAALSNDATRAHLLQTLQSNPTLVHFLVSKVQPQLASQVTRTDQPTAPLLQTPRPQHSDRILGDRLTGYSGASTSQSIIQAALSGNRSVAAAGGFSSGPGDWSGGGFDRRHSPGGIGGTDSLYQSTSGPPGALGGFAGMDVGILQDLLAATAPLLDTGESERMPLGGMPGWRGGRAAGGGGGGSGDSPHAFMMGQSPAHRPSPSQGSGGHGGGFDPSFRRGGEGLDFAGPPAGDLLNLLGRPMPGGGGDVRDGRGAMGGGAGHLMHERGGGGLSGILQPPRYGSGPPNVGLPLPLPGSQHYASR